MMPNGDINFWRALCCLFTGGHDFIYTHNRKVSIYYRCTKCNWPKIVFYHRGHS